MTYAVLDTSVVLSSGLPALSGNLAVSAATLAELQFGLLVVKDDSERARRLRRFSLVERLFEPLAVDERVAQSYGELASQVARSGQNPRARTMDLLIAATAHAHRAGLFTRNIKDFRGVMNLVDVVEV